MLLSRFDSERDRSCFASALYLRFSFVLAFAFSTLRFAAFSASECSQSTFFDEVRQMCSRRTGRYLHLFDFISFVRRFTFMFSRLVSVRPFALSFAVVHMVSQHKHATRSNCAVSLSQIERRRHKRLSLSSVGRRNSWIRLFSRIAIEFSLLCHRNEPPREPNARGQKVPIQLHSFTVSIAVLYHFC